MNGELQQKGKNTWKPSLDKGNPDWILGKKGIGLTDDLVRKILKAESPDYFIDAVVKAVKNSDGYADDIIEQIIKYGDDAADAIGKYGDDAAELIKDYGDGAVEKLKNGKSPKKILLKELIILEKKCQMVN